ncbi:MAG: alpha/beta hydrolase [Gammaproteobacteria bacterium]|nr:alpha/beta hydrolase [Gammaproteobacteria bacterium]
MATPYVPKHLAVSHYHTIRGLRNHVSCWGDDHATPLLLLHGWMDCGSTFQFVADYLADNWYVIAPDLRGFGESEWCVSGYWFPDYLADLEALLHIYSPDQSVNLIGHSMGGNVACLYAGVRPERIRSLINLEGLGLPPTDPKEAPGRYRSWLNALNEPASFRHFGSLMEFADFLRARNPYLPKDRALFVAGQWSKEDAQGFIPKADPAHKLPNPVLYRREEAEACWRQISAPTLFVAGAKSEHMVKFIPKDADARRAVCFSNLKEVIIDDCGHMLHHDQPQRLAQVIEQFVA